MSTIKITSLRRVANQVLLNTAHNRALPNITVCKCPWSARYLGWNEINSSPIYWKWRATAAPGCRPHTYFLLLFKQGIIVIEILLSNRIWSSQQLSRPKVEHAWAAFSIETVCERSSTVVRYTRDGKFYKTFANVSILNAAKEKKIQMHWMPPNDREPQGSKAPHI